MDDTGKGGKNKETKPKEKRRRKRAIALFLALTICGTKKFRHGYFSCPCQLDFI